MKKLITILIAVFLTASIILPRQSNAQAPEIMKYQAVARDNAGNVIANQLISFRISILLGSSSGTSVFSETHSVTSNDFGLANLNIGNGTIVSGEFSSIDWSSDLYFLQVEMDESGGSTYQLMGTSQLLSVPYALHAKTAYSLTNGMNTLSDADGNTKIQVEKYPNEDVIHFDMAGTEFFKMDNGRLDVLNTGRSVFVGEGAGANDDLSDNQNVAIGVAALEENTDRGRLVALGDSALYNNGVGATEFWHGTENTALGSKSLYSNTAGFSNTATGFESMESNSTGFRNTANGYRSLYSNTTGNYNTAIGSQALFSNTIGFSNTAIGYLSMHTNDEGIDNTSLGFKSLYSNTTGERNTANGFDALNKNSTGNDNTATGHQTLFSNTSGFSNIAIGVKALYYNTDRSNLVAVGDSALFNNGIGVTLSFHATENTALGSKSLYSNTTGYKNTASGNNALYTNTTGSSNTANGSKALYSNTSGYENTAIGETTLYLNTTGLQNTAVGAEALYSNLNGWYNTAIGRGAMHSSTSGYNNTAVGRSTLFSNTTADDNTAVGNYSLYSNTTGYENTAIGTFAFYYTTTAGRNVGVGYKAGYNNATGFYNTAVGWQCGPASSNIKNSTALGRGASTTATNQIRIGNNIVTSIGGYTGWSNISDKRFEKAIQNDIVGLDFIMALQPVSYQLDMDKLDQSTGSNRHVSDSSFKETEEELEFNLQSKLEKGLIRQSGFLAQDVEQAAISVGYDFSGVDKPKNEEDFYGLRYAEFVVPLVKAVQELADQNNQQLILIEELKSRIEELEK